MKAVNRSAGFTLIEVLVAMAILSIGLLGVVGLHVATVADTGSARLATLARIAADDMAERIRSNPGPAARVRYSTIRASDAGNSPPAVCRTVSCSPVDMASLDAGEWQAVLAETLPGGQGDVRCMASGQGECTTLVVTVIWQSPHH